MADITIDVNPQQSPIDATPQTQQQSIDIQVVEDPVIWGTIAGTLSNQIDLQQALDSKQPNIPDLETIRSGAALGATALQSVPEEYVTETELQAYHDSTKQDVTDNNLTTTNKTIVGAINEVNAKPVVASLEELTDVTITTPIEGQGLRYNATTQKWENGETSSYHPSLFQSFWSDHLLNRVDMLRADTFSWQSGTVYTAGYQELLSEYNNASSTTETDGGEWVSSNITPYGNLIDDEGIISGFTSNTTFASFNAITPTSSFEIVVKCKQDTLTANSSIIYNNIASVGVTLRVVNASTGQINMWIWNGGSAIINNVNTNATLSANTWTWFKIAWDGTNITVSQSTDGTTYTQTYTNTLSTPPAFSQGTQTLGGGSRETYPFTNGYIDLNETYLNIDGEIYWTGCNYTPIITYKRTPKGYKIADATQEQAILDLYNSKGVAWYYILDTTNTRFKLPRINADKEILDTTTTVPVVGNGYSLGLTNGTTNYSFFPSSDQQNLSILTTGGFNKAIGTSISRGTDSSSGKAIGVITDATKSGLIADLSSKTGIFKGHKYLYFYVGNYTQSAIEQTAGLNTELFNDKVDLDGNNATFPHIVETYSNGTEWYRVWSDGWCEQGGQFTTNNAITYLKPFLDNNYSIFISSAQGGSAYDMQYQNKTSTGFTPSNYQSQYSMGSCWEAKGYIAEE